MLTAKYLLDKTKIGISGESADWRSLYDTIHNLMEMTMSYDEEDGVVTMMFFDFLKRMESSCVNNIYSVQDFQKRDLLILNGLIKVIAQYAVLSKADEVNILLMNFFVDKTLGQSNAQLCAEYLDFLKLLDSVKDICQFTSSFSELTAPLFNQIHHHEK